MGKMTLEKERRWFKKTERLLYDYKTYDSAIRVLEAERQAIAGSLDEDIMPQMTANVSVGAKRNAKALFGTSQTERWGIKRAEISRRRVEQIDKSLIIRKSRRDAIKEARRNLTEEEDMFVFLRYDSEKSHDEAMQLLAKRGYPSSRRNYFYMRKEVIEKVARYLGFL